MSKTRDSVQNLRNLYLQNKVDSQDFKILKILKKIKRYKMQRILKHGFQQFSKTMEKNLLSENPSLLIYDLYKLGYLCSL